ncbi:hypothetical protein G6F68_015147 [Rhizopus microsporus]|nr:hypothetical protein G6F68_015147 [Rhizopus microsporus]
MAMMMNTTGLEASGQNTLGSPSITPRPRPVTMAPMMDPMPPITTTANTTMMSQHAGKARQRHAEAVGQRDHAGHVHAEGLDQARVFGAGAQQGVEDFRAGARDVVAGKTLLQGGDG